MEGGGVVMCETSWPRKRLSQHLGGLERASGCGCGRVSFFFGGGEGTPLTVSPLMPDDGTEPVANTSCAATTAVHVGAPEPEPTPAHAPAPTAASSRPSPASPVLKPDTVTIRVEVWVDAEVHRVFVYAAVTSLARVSPALGRALPVAVTRAATAAGMLAAGRYGVVPGQPLGRVRERVMVRERAMTHAPAQLRHVTPSEVNLVGR
jgi:hypothetical protein